MTHSRLSAAGAFVRLSRPHFLVGGAVMFGLGAAVAGGIDIFGYIAGQLMVTAAQLTAHYVNEYADVEPDRMVSRRTWFSGGSGVLVDGILAPDAALRAAFISSGIAVAAAALLAVQSPAASLLGLGALAISWVYSMPPIRLLGTGFGELATSVVVAMMVPIVGSLAQVSGVTAGLWWSVVILLPVHMAMMLAFELPDLETDRAAGKSVLAVRIGERATVTVMASLVAASALLVVVAWSLNGIPTTAAIITFAGLPTLALGWFAARTEQYGLLTAAAVSTFALLGAGLTLGWLAG